MASLGRLEDHPGCKTINVLAQLSALLWICSRPPCARLQSILMEMGVVVIVLSHHYEFNALLFFALPISEYYYYLLKSNSFWNQRLNYIQGKILANYLSGHFHVNHILFWCEKNVYLHFHKKVLVCYDFSTL